MHQKSEITNEYFNNFVDALEKILLSKGHQVTIFIKSDKRNYMQNYKKGLRLICFEDNLGEQYSYMGYEAAFSYQLWEEVSRTIDEYEDYPDIIEISDYEAIGYYILQKKWIKEKKLLNSNIILSNIKNDKYYEKNINKYRFPYYWIEKMDNFCSKAADKVITDIGLEYDEICKKLDDRIQIYEQLIINSSKRQKGKYPISDSIPVKKEVERNVGSKELLSVIIPYYNLGEYITETLDSILVSDYQHKEIIIVNDGSNDSYSLEILNEIKKKNIANLKITNIPNKGLANARNIGALMAKGEYIAFLDADDFIDKTYYSKAIDLLNEYENISYVYSWVEFFGEKDGIWPTFNTELPYLLLTNMLCAFPVIRKADFVRFGLNRMEMDKGMEDHESWINMCRNGCSGISIPEPLVKYRIRINSMSRKFDRNIVVSLYEKIASKHGELYERYGQEIFNIINANGPGYLWNNPTIEYPELGYISSGTDENSENINFQKYELMRIANSKWGSRILKMFFKFKIHKLFAK